jgi:hypothetical protein
MLSLGLPLVPFPLGAEFSQFMVGLDEMVEGFFCFNSLAMPGV